MANPVAIVIDSTATIPKEFLDDLPIRVVPTMLHWKGESYRDNIDIFPTEFYERLKIESEMPTTSQVPPSLMGAAFDELLDQGYDVLAILLSSKISGTFQSGVLAKSDRPDNNITILDSLSSGMGSGWAAVYTARAAKAGADLAACTEIAREAILNTGVVGTVYTLEYLHRAGRIGTASRFLGSALNLKPVIKVKDGTIEGVDRVRTRRKAIAKMLDILEQDIGGRTPIYLAVMHANDLETAEKLVEIVTPRFNPVELVVTEFSPILGTNFGEGTVGICYLAGME